MSELLKWCFEHWPSLTAVVILIGIAIVITYKLTTKYHHWTSKITTSENECLKIDGHIVPRLTTIDTSIINLGSSFDSLLVYLKSKDVTLDPRLIKAFSPIQLTEIGHAILEKSGGKTYVENNLGSLITDMEAQKFKSALDVQNYATIFFIKNFNSDDLITIRNYIYQNPTYKTADGEIQINISVINQIMGIYLRDKYFEKHPELKEKE